MTSGQVVTYPPEVWIPLATVFLFGWLRLLVGPCPTPRMMTLCLLASMAPWGGVLLGVNTIPKVMVFISLVAFCVFCGVELEKGRRKK